MSTAAPSTIEYPQRIRFLCNFCGLCCGDTRWRRRRVLALGGEVEKISRETGLASRSFAKLNRGDLETFPFELRKRGGLCVFLESGRCAIYSHRPLLCRLYPFWIERERGRFRFDYTKECPGVGVGEELEAEFFQGLLKTSVERLGFKGGHPPKSSPRDVQRGLLKSRKA